MGQKLISDSWNAANTGSFPYTGYRHLIARRTTTNATMFAGTLTHRKVGTDNAKHVWLK